MWCSSRKQNCIDDICHSMGECAWPRTCIECSHSDYSHKWYAQSESFNDEEHWECKEELCDCTVVWSDYPFADD